MRLSEILYSYHGIFIIRHDANFRNVFLSFEAAIMNQSDQNKIS